MQETVLSPYSTSKVHVSRPLVVPEPIDLVPESIDLFRAKPVRNRAWLDSRITASILVMPGPVAVCILESENPTGPEIRYVKVILR